MANVKEKRKSNIPLKDVNKNTDTVLVYKDGMTVSDLASGLNKPLGEVVKKLFLAGVMATQNQVISRDAVELVCMDYNVEIKDEVVTDLERFDEISIVDDEKDLLSRPAIVTIMGHVDHGKTTLLDYIRQSKVVLGEAGGITQHIGAYQVSLGKNHITFIDTPGHAAFTEMRARGAQITDIIILVVAADDGVMPQTEEAIEHAKAAKCPIIVAINKCDKPHANPEKVMTELAEHGLLPDTWGGDTPFVEISALKGTGVDALLDMVLLVAEMNEYKANPNRLAIGTVIEAELNKGKGPVATLLVQNGTLKIGDYVAVGDTYGKVRTMEDETHKKLNEALPSKAVLVTGLEDVPLAGDKFMALSDERTARNVSLARKEKTKTLNNLNKNTTFDFASLDEHKELNLIIKGDVQGSIEAIKGSINKIQVEDIKINIIRAAVGAISETDVNFAVASHAIIIGFNVRPTGQVKNMAQENGIEIRLYNIIYKLLDDVEAALKGMLDPEYEDVVTGFAEVRQTFKVSKLGTIAGCYVTDGVIERGSLVRILRNGVVIFEGKMASLKRFKDDVKEVKQGYECGITIDGFNDIKEADVIEASIMKEVEHK